MSNFTYHGGGIISNPAVTVIYARSISINPDGTPGLPTWIDSTNTFNVPISEVCLYNNFIYDLIDSPFMDLLSKNFSISGGPAIGRGSFTGSYIIDLPFNQKDGNVLQITHADIEKMIDNAVQNGTIPAPAKNTVYVVYVNNIQVTVPNSSDVVGVSAGGFHNPFQLSNGFSAVYCLIEDGINDLVTFNTTHELVECITDPYLSGWYDENGKEVCDICPPPGRYTIDQIKAAGTMYHGNLISKFWSPNAGGCIGPADDNNKKKGPYLKIESTRLHSDSCSFGYLEGSEVTFSVSGMLDTRTTPVSGIFWSQQFAQVVKIFNGKFTIIVPPAGQSFKISVTAYNDWGCQLSAEKTFIAISEQTIQLQHLICKMRHEILSYWRFIDPLWDPLRDFTLKPLSIFEIHALNKLASGVSELHAQYRGLENTGFNDRTYDK